MPRGKWGQRVNAAPSNSPLDRAGAKRSSAPAVETHVIVAHTLSQEPSRVGEAVLLSSPKTSAQPRRTPLETVLMLETAEDRSRHDPPVTLP